MSRPPTDTEERLFDEALTLFATNGYAATSVREIIETVGLTKPVLYYYCKNKLDLFEKLVSRVHKEALAGLAELAKGEGNPTEKLRLILHGTFSFCRKDWRVPRLMFSAAFGARIPEIEAVMQKASDQRYRMIRSIVEDGLKKGALLKTDVDVLTIGFCSLMDHPINLMSRDASGVEKLTPELAECLFQIFASGAAKSPS